MADVIAMPRPAPIGTAQNAQQLTDLMALKALAGTLGLYSYRYAHELQLHERMAQVLTDAGYSFEREFVLDAKNRADFWLDGLVIEVKVDGGHSCAVRQASRYIQLPHVRGVLLASTQRWARGGIAGRPTLAGKAAWVVHLRRQSL